MDWVMSSCMMDQGKGCRASESSAAHLCLSLKVTIKGFLHCTAGFIHYTPTVHLQPAVVSFSL